MRKRCASCDRTYPPEHFRCPACGLRLQLVPQSDVAGKYVVQRLLASGGMSQVYLARQKSLDREIALKVVFLDPGDSVSVEALRNEAFLAGRVQHPHIVSVVDHGEADGGILYLAMELLHGSTLADTLFRSGPMDYVRALRILVQICEALAGVHEAGLVYRDIKPANLFLVDTQGGTDFVKLLDFGICTPAPRPSFRLFAASATETTGTPQYMSPEQIQGRPADARSDLYSLGVTAHEMLTGKAMFRGPDPFTAALKAVPLPLAIAWPQGRIPRGLDDFLLRLMARDPAQRPRDAREVLERLRQLLPSASHSAAEASAARVSLGPDPEWFEAERPRVILKTPDWVDRPREMLWVDTELASLERGRQGLLWVEGEPGVGKSALAGRALEVASRRPFAIASGLVESRMPVLGAWRLALANLLGHEIESRDSLRETLRSVGMGTPPDGDPAFEPLVDVFFAGSAAMDLLRRDRTAFLSYAASGIERVLRAAAAPTGLVLHLDDFHLADPLSAEFLGILVRSLEIRPAPLFLLITARRPLEEHSGTGTSEFLKVRAAFRERGALQRLTRMTDRQVGALVDAMCPGRCHPQVQRAVRRAAGGNPMFAMQMCRHLATQGALVLTETGVGLVESSDVSVPGALMDLLVQRVDGLRGLSDGTLLVDLLDRVAMLASRSSMSNLWTLCDAEGRLDLRDGLDRLVDRLAAEGYVQRVPWASDDFVTFPHPLMRDAILQRGPSSSLARLHLFAARVLESAYADDVPAMAQDVGEHYFDAGFFDRAIDYLLVAAEGALEAARLAEARDLFTKAETAFSRIGLPADPRLARVLASLVELDWCQGRYDAAAEGLRALTERHLVPAASPLAIRLDELEARVAESRRDHARAVVMLERLIADAKTAGDRHRAATALVRLAKIRMDSGDNPAAANLVVEAEALIRSDGDTRTMGLLHLARGRLLYKIGPAEEALDRFDSALLLLSGPRDFADRAEALFFKSAQLASLGRRSEAIEVNREGVMLCETYGFARGLAGHLTNLGASLGRVGCEEEGRAAIQRSLAIRESMDDRRGIAHALTALADLALARHDWDAVRELSGKSLALCHAANYVLGKRVALVNLALACRGLGQGEEARSHLRACLGTTRDDKSLSQSIGSAHQILADLLEEAEDTGAAMQQRYNAIQVFEQLGLADRAREVRLRLGIPGPP